MCVCVCGLPAHHFLWPLLPFECLLLRPKRGPKHIRTGGGGLLRLLGISRRWRFLLFFCKRLHSIEIACCLMLPGIRASEARLRPLDFTTGEVETPDSTPPPPSPNRVEPLRPCQLFSAPRARGGGDGVREPRPMEPRQLCRCIQPCVVVLCARCHLV